MRLVQIFSLCLLLVLVSCGYKAPTNATPVSKIKDRVLLANSQSNLIQVIDAQTDILSTFTISVSAAPTKLVESADKATTLVYDSAAHQVAAISNAKETEVGSSIALPAATESLAISPNGQIGYAALQAARCSGSVIVGAVGVIDFANSKIKSCVAVAAARHIVLSHNGSTLLVFSDNSNTVNAVNTTSLAVVAIGPASFDQPVSAVFSADDSSAFILSCGSECGGTAASVTSVSAVGSAAPVIGASTALDVGREGLLNGPTLYVAGTNPNVGGELQIVDTGTLTASVPVAITDGIHDTIALQGSTIFIGARGCSNSAHGCLSMVDAGSKQVFFNRANTGADDITGMEAIPGRSTVYICEGGELRIYDAGTRALQALQIDIVGNAQDVREVF